VIHAKGTGMEAAQKFLGFSLASEKEIVLMVVTAENKNEIMRAVSNACGLHSEAKGLVLSLPIDSVMGI